MKKWFLKNIEVYDGDWSSHYISFFGFILLLISTIIFLPLTIIFCIIGFIKLTCIFFILMLVFYTVGQTIGISNRFSKK